MQQVLITGGSGFFGKILKQELSEQGYNITSYDIVQDHDELKNVENIVGDIRDENHLNQILSKKSYDTIFHCAAIFSNENPDPNLLWTSNAIGTKILANCAKKNGVKKFIFLSSKYLWSNSTTKFITEDDLPNSREQFGFSKLIGEFELEKHTNDMNVIIFRIPTVVDAGRLGVLSIFFEFIYEGRKTWLIGNGNNRQQFISASDLVNACIKANSLNNSHTLNIGSDNVPTVKEMYQHLIDKADTGARIGMLPQKITLELLKITRFLNISPLELSHYRTLTQDFVFDTTKAKSVLDWKPTKNNMEMLWDAYSYYKNNYEDIYSRKNTSAHRRPTPMGIIRLLKWLS